MHTERGFTLVELSIVLVILGLLIGGVLTGQSLIRAAELRSVATQQARYVTAVQTFRDKYFALPGDMTNATAYWGAADGSTGLTAGCKTTASTTATTCNGDGDGRVNFTPTSSAESYRFWQQLANAGLIEGSYDGIVHGGTTGSTTANAPVGRISSSLWYVMNNGGGGAITGNTGAFDGQYDNYLLFGATSATNPPLAALLKPEEAYNIDMKIDDGKPAIGKLSVYQPGGWTGTGCTSATASSQVTVDYLLTNAALACAMYFRQAF